MNEGSFTDAFEHGYGLGFDTGYEIGDAHGYDRAGREFTAAITGVRQALGGPPQEELDRLRSTLRSCACGRCSACCRRAVIARNRRRFGSDDYPGAGQATRTTSQNTQRGAA